MKSKSSRENKFRRTTSPPVKQEKTEKIKSMRGKLVFDENFDLKRHQQR